MTVSFEVMSIEVENGCIIPHQASLYIAKGCMLTRAESHFYWCPIESASPGWTDVMIFF
jgi:hypothetical protein